jgi:CheY-like chemotaxis protein/AraC-like DNA-binding protein
MSNSANARGPRVLLVDDSPEELRLLVTLLGRQNYKLAIALSGQEACERIQGGLRPDLIILDVAMPRMDGITTCRVLHAYPGLQDVPIILLTASPDLETRLAGFSAGAVDYVLKPCDPAEVLARIHVHLGSEWPAQQAPIGALTEDEALVKATVQYLAANLAEAPSQRSLATLMGVNEKRLAQSFRAALGCTPHEFLGEERIRVAKKRLSDSSDSVAEIAESLGFSSAGNFATVFRRRVGMTPLAYRKLGSSAAGSSQDAPDDREP